MSKSTYLKSIETTIQDNVSYETNIDKTKKKFFGCFPYPYMNGKLHLGHAFTILKVDFECRYRKLIGYNVLFPFGFHVTGIPIYAAAKKLEKELTTGIGSQYNIMKSMDIPEEDIYKFINPEEWVRYFPNMGIKHIKKLGAMVDYRRSFVTTEINPFYDSFVRWQFEKLFHKNYLKFGTRNSIYSEALKIQCQDHDRSSAEGVQNTTFSIYELETEDGTIYIPYENNFGINKPYNAKITSKQKYNKYLVDDKVVYMTDYVYRNYSAQNNNMIFKLLDTDIIKYPDVSNTYSHTYFEYLGGEVEYREEKYTSKQTISLSTELVIDRMGEICIVKPVEQWYIDYADSEWKKLAVNCINKMDLTETIKSRLLKGVEWIKEWGVSRTFGLGTKIPFDTRFIIDSLSDSTIYQAYYTVAHLIHKDIYGKVSDFNPVDFTTKVWDFIFFGIWDDAIKIDRDSLEKMRESFEYFYPVDIRVSGKDLLTNHLIMYIFNHCAIFDEKHYPVSINCNGWVLVDGEKMAKSKGNFITIESALEENSVDAVRLTLADSGDGIDDANYETKKASEVNTLKLYTFVDSVEKFVVEQEQYTTDMHEIDIIFKNIFDNIFINIINAYETKKYKSIVRDVFYIMNNLKEKYRIYSKYFNRKPNIDIMKYIINNQVKLIYPIVPHISTYLSSKLNIELILENNFKYDDKIIDRFNKTEEIIGTIREKFEKLKKKGKKFTKCIVTNIDIVCNINDNEKIILKNQVKTDFEFVSDSTGIFKTQFIE